MPETVFLTHDNTIDLLLKSSGVAQDLSDVTKITATFGSTTITSTDHINHAIKWNIDGYSTGEIRLDLGAESISAGSYYVAIVVYDAINVNGIVWGYITIVVMADVEN